MEAAIGGSDRRLFHLSRLFLSPSTLKFFTPQLGLIPECTMICNAQAHSGMLSQHTHKQSLLSQHTHKHTLLSHHTHKHTAVLKQAPYTTCLYVTFVSHRGTNTSNCSITSLI